MKKMWVRRILGTVVLVVMGASAAYSLNFAGLRDKFPPPAVAAASALSSPSAR